MEEAKADIGLIGLAVMGENLVLNMESKGFTVAVFNRTLSKVLPLTHTFCFLPSSLLFLALCKLLIPLMLSG
jgi:6-phosphogluconate dehydrogenase (decarboxylating)